ncbi:uncharacterized protein PADG_06020 [Paracoccidioides brasiliensis Pb18]|uniref:Uncharacterized protein n=1 Tax=Paracoccidioides brasiliensis (strain Pb18) TaxID=502780 RepID=C1GFI4_PARBD|nr:uncharacterized protein PADG_06020 [Paracoccidioides brasiliensis Pb18]EEH49941.2 hypothetical protein PADG_06020 [Paracoccidioides brasiliensis Pb18]
MASTCHNLLRAYDPVDSPYEVREPAHTPPPPAPPPKSPTYFICIYRYETLDKISQLPGPGRSRIHPSPLYHSEPRGLSSSVMRCTYSKRASGRAYPQHSSRPDDLVENAVAPRTKVQSDVLSNRFCIVI